MDEWVSKRSQKRTEDKSTKDERKKVVIARGRGIESKHISPPKSSNQKSKTKKDVKRICRETKKSEDNNSGTNVRRGKTYVARRDGARKCITATNQPTKPTNHKPFKKKSNSLSH